MKRSNVTVWQATTLLVALALDVLIFVPFAPYLPHEELDASWRYATNYALNHGFQFGKSLIFTSGPLSFVYIRQYYPGYYILMLGLSALVIAAATIGMWSVARRSRRTLIIVLPMLLAQIPDFDAVFLFVPLLLLWVAARSAERRAKTVVLALLTVVCALLPLVKGSFAIAVLVLCGLAFAVDARDRPVRAVGLVASFAGTLAAAWLACGQAPATFAAYVTSEAQIISGYTDAMSLPGPASEPILFIIAAAALILISALVAFDRRRFVCAFGLAVALFLCFKAGFVRQDGHVLIATSALLQAGLLVTMAGRGRLASLALPLGIAAWCLISWPYLPIDTLSDLSRAAETVKESADTVASLATDRGGMRRAYEAALAGVRARHPLEQAAGTVDLYPTDIAIVLANGLAWDPRPVIQSYSAYTDHLALLNAQSLVRPDAPDSIFFSIATIDGRYPALDDGRSWPALAARYRPVAMRDAYVELRKRDVPVSTTTGAPVVDRDAGLGEKVALPAGPLWAEIDVEPTLPGRLVSAAYKLPLLTLTIDYADGASRDFRFIASVARGGFLLSPTIERASSLVSLESSAASRIAGGPQPVAFSIAADGPVGHLWRTRFHVLLKPITFPQAPGVETLLFSALKPLNGGLPSSFEGECAVDAVADRDGAEIALGDEIGVLNIKGWAMMSAAEGRANLNVSMAFIPDDGGAILAAPLPKLASPGLAQHFGTPAAGDAAFDADVDVRRLPAGRYHLQLVQEGDDGARQCRHRAIALDRR